MNGDGTYEQGVCMGINTEEKKPYNREARARFSTRESQQAGYISCAIDSVRANPDGVEVSGDRHGVAVDHADYCAPFKCSRWPSL